MKAVLASLILTVSSIIFGNNLIQIFKKEGTSKQCKELHCCIAVVAFLVSIYLIELPNIWII